MRSAVTVSSTPRVSSSAKEGRRGMSCWSQHLGVKLAPASRRIPATEKPIPPVKLTESSALQLSIMSYLAMLAGVAVMAAVVHWMARTYDAAPSMAQSVVFAAYTATPLFVGGLAALYPNMWLAMFVGIAAICYTVYLLYVGIPTFMNIPTEEGFLFSSSVLAVGLVVLVSMIALSVIFWGFGVGPVYTS